MPYVWYNQMQAYHFWLNHTQGIIMNYLSYWLPNYWHPLVMKGADWQEHTFWWMSIHKPSVDMPTLQIGEGTYRENIRSLLALWILDRQIAKIDGMSRAYYRVTEKWLTHSTYQHPSDFATLYNTIGTLLEKREISEWNVKRLIVLLSSYTEEKPTKETSLSLDKEWMNEFSLAILQDLERWKDILNIGGSLDNDWVKENIIDQIKKVGARSSWYKVWVDGWADADTRRIILRTFTKMMDWYISNNKKIKNMKLTINTWFSKDKL